MNNVILIPLFSINLKNYICLILVNVIDSVPSVVCTTRHLFMYNKLDTLFSHSFCFYL